MIRFVRLVVVKTDLFCFVMLLVVYEIVLTNMIFNLFKGSSILPPHLECFKFGESDSLQSFPSSSASHASSCPGTPISPPGPSGDNTSNVVSAPNAGSKTKSPSVS